MLFASNKIVGRFRFGRTFFIWLLIFPLCCISVFAQDSAAISTENLIHPGDLIDVDFVGSVEYDWRGTLTPEGFLNGLDFADQPVYALCRDETQIAAAVAAAYSKLLRDPQIVVKVIDRSNRPPATIYGAIKNEQRFQIMRPVRLNELIVLAGGLTDRTSGEIEILRQPRLNCLSDETAVPTGDGTERARFIAAGENQETQIIKLQIADLLSGKINPPIFSGDTVTITEAAPVYIIGGVVTPQKISFRNQLTLSRAIAAAGGLAKDADAGTLTIFRRDGAATKIINADYGKITASETDDIILQAFDIVEVAVKGRGKSKYPPVVKTADAERKIAGQLPLRIVD